MFLRADKVCNLSGIIPLTMLHIMFECIEPILQDNFRQAILQILNRNIISVEWD